MWTLLSIFGFDRDTGGKNTSEKCLHKRQQDNQFPTEGNRPSADGSDADGRKRPADTPDKSRRKEEANTQDKEQRNNNNKNGFHRFLSLSF